MLKVVIDTNVIVSAFLKRGSYPDHVFSLAKHGSFSTYLSKEVFSEYTSVLKRSKFKHLLYPDVAKELAVLKSSAAWVDPVSIDLALHDQSDVKFLTCAIAARADFLITGNIKHFPKTFRSVEIVTPRQFCDKFLDELSLAA